MTYTQTEVLRLKEELRAAKEQEQSIRTLQQRQLDSVQVQLREMDQRLSEVVDAVTELFNKQKSIHDLLGRLLHDFDALKGQTQQTIPATMIPHTQPYCTTCLPLERSLQQYRVQHCFSDELPTCLYVPQTVLSDQVTCVEFSAMCDMSIEIDRVLSFLTTRRHLLFFYSYPQGYPTEPVETMLRRHGNDMVYELEMFMHGCYERGIPFPAVVHPYFIQGPTAFAPMTFDAPAFPHVLCFASVCRSWFQSIARAIRNRLYVNTQRLLQVAGLRHDTVEWLHLPNEDRVRFRSWLTTEITLPRVIAPLRD